MEKVSKRIIECFKRGGKLLIFGNGGSASQANHFACELVCSFEKKRAPLPAISLANNDSILTAWSNDNVDGFDMVFARQVAALGRKEDLVVSLSTSGRSKNCLYALEEARILGIGVIDFPRKGRSTAEIQEYQLRLIHKICREIEGAMFL